MTSSPADKIMALDREAVRRSFEEAVTTYDEAAVLQRQVADELIDRLSLIHHQPESILDLGCGTGYCTRALAGQYKSARITGLDLAHGMAAHARKRSGWLARHKQRYLSGDAERLPFANDTFDLVVSSLTLQWCDPDLAFPELARVLRPGGVLMYSSFGPDTLQELRQAWSEVDYGVHVHDFLDMHDLGDAMLRAGLADPVVDMDKAVMTYADVRSLLKDLKAIGAHNAADRRPRGLTGRGHFERLERAYSSFSDVNGRLPATYEIIYGHAMLARTAGVGVQTQLVNFSAR